MAVCMGCRRDGVACEKGKRREGGSTERDPLDRSGNSRLRGPFLPALSDCVVPQRTSDMPGQFMKSTNINLGLGHSMRSSLTYKYL